MIPHLTKLKLQRFDMCDYDVLDSLPYDRLRRYVQTVKESSGLKPEGTKKDDYIKFLLDHASVEFLDYIEEHSL